MTAPVFELKRETIVRLQKEVNDLKSERDATNSKYSAVIAENMALVQENEALKAARNPIYRLQRRLKRRHKQ